MGAQLQKMAAIVTSTSHRPDVVSLASSAAAGLLPVPSIAEQIIDEHNRVSAAESNLIYIGAQPA